MENARNLGTFDCFPKYICLISNGITVAACLPYYLYSPIYLGCQELFFRSPRSRKTGKTYICPQLRDGAADGELVVGEEDNSEKQEQWNTRPGPPKHDDSQDEDDP